MKHAMHMILTAVCALLLLPGTLFAGKYAGEFLALGLGARGLAMGQAMTALSDDPFSFIWNPAGLARVDQRSISGTAATNFGTVGDPLSSHMHLGYTMPIGPANIAINYVRLAISEIPRYPGYSDTDYILEERRRLIEEHGGAPDGFFDASDQALYLSFARMSQFQLGFGWLYRPLVLRVPYGVNAKVLYSNLDSENAQGLGVDTGIQMITPLYDMLGWRYLGELTLGLRLDNMTNTGLNWDGGTDAINYNWVTGLAWSTDIGDTKIALACDWDHRYDTTRHAGIELSYLNRVALRLGHQGRDGDITYGAGLQLGHIGIDYAGLEHVLGRVHRMSFSYAF